MAIDHYDMQEGLRVALEIGNYVSKPFKNSPHNDVFLNLFWFYHYTIGLYYPW